MTAEIAGGSPGRVAKALAVASVACFWLLPIAPMVAIGAVATNRGASGWSPRLAATGAGLCVAYTVALAVGFVRLALPVVL